MDKTESPDHGDRPGLTAPMAWTDEMGRWERTGKLDPLAGPDGTELRGWTAVTALPVSPVQPVRRDHPAYLARAARRANGARRVSRVLREILARLVRRANL